MNAQKILLGLSLIALSFSTEAQPWLQVNVPTQENLNDIQFIDDQVGYIAGDNYTLLKTVDGGETWDTISHQGLPSSSWLKNIQEIEFVDANIGYLTIEEQGWMYKTSDGGLNWAQVQNNQTNQCYPVSIFLNGEDDMFIGGVSAANDRSIAAFKVQPFIGM
ncbi:MAG: hypothetical protein DCO96_16025 [Fluviicola sp. XM-24bin1]|nr:MAG: hypothetical protein DCO96_16025 [Fluviicola sp. XM-24bin1]